MTMTRHSVLPKTIELHNKKMRDAHKTHQFAELFKAEERARLARALEIVEARLPQYDELPLDWRCRS
jgi:hypothetical protein